MLLKTAYNNGYKEGYKVGIKEVIDWIQENSTGCEEGLTLHLCLQSEEWESKLKEWNK